MESQKTSHGTGTIPPVKTGAPNTISSLPEPPASQSQPVVFSGWIRYFSTAFGQPFY